MNRPFAYVCAPIAGEAGSSTKKLRSYCRKLYDNGYLPIAPTLLFQQFINMNVPTENNDRITMASDLLRRCRVVVVCGRINTEVMTGEIELARKLGIVITTLDGIERIGEFMQSEADGED
ncbi:MAG: hypothetical protein IKZ82_12615 [Clostridia bacterium]|nr:hypothetical protein [Clostridia bacterium]